jgi:hypothetical protein
MKKLILPAFILIGGLSLAACGGSDPVAEDAENVTALPSVDNVAGGRDGAPSADGSPPQAGTNTPTASASTGRAAAIPSALQGRWGLTPGDCTAARGDDKGVLVVASNGLQFYESTAVPAANVQASDDSFSADFAFSGEGQNWTKYQALTLDDDRLVRTESSPMASFTYARCR